MPGRSVPSSFGSVRVKPPLILPGQRIGRRAGHEDDVHRLDVAVQGRPVERGHAIALRRIDVRTVPDERAERLEVAAWVEDRPRTRVSTLLMRRFETVEGALREVTDDRVPARGERRVVLTLPAGEAFAIALHATLVLGAVAVPIDPRLGGEQARRQAAGAAAVIDTPLAGAPGDPETSLPESHDLDAPAIVVHTSGTTADARAVELTYGNWLWSALGSAVALGRDPEDRWLCCLPVWHVGGLSILLRSAIGATTAVVHERFEPGLRELCDVVRARSQGEARFVIQHMPPERVAAIASWTSATEN